MDLVDDILEELIARVAKVRRWLLALSALRTAALWLVCVSLYVGLYAFLDHRFGFGTFGRLLALVLLVGLLAVLSYYLVRTLRREMTYSRAANHIENRHSFDQQLVAAVEYYEKGDAYPYSKGLARQLVLQVDAVSRDFAFDSTVEKWRGYLLASCIVLCLSIVTLFVHQNIVYFSAYMSRLVRPFSAIAPVPTATIESITGDVVAAPNVPVTLVAEVEGRTPEFAELVVTRQRPAEANDVAPEQIVARISAAQTEQRATSEEIRGSARFTASPSFETLGEYTYHFQTTDGRSATHTITVAQPPAIESITAVVSLPSEGDGPSLPARDEKIENGSLAVLPYSRIELVVKTTTPLREATVHGLGEQPVTQAVNGERTFSVGLTADSPASLSFSLVGAEGLVNSDPEQLRIALKSDEPPQFKLRSPEGDYLATDVASIPIEFEVSDDFGLDAAELYCELPGGELLILDTSDPQGARQVRLAQTLELERYDLKVGDSLLFYARAADIVTGQRRTDANSYSDIYFVEIRPYRQYWHPQSGGGPGNAPGIVPEDLTTVLEYTRAILKKTWALAQRPTTAERDRPQFEALCSDVEYCTATLAHLRDDPETGFDEATKSAISEAIGLHTQARRRLSVGDADGALGPVREAYRLLRKLVDELHLKWNPPSSGQNVPQEKPERITLQERPDIETAQDQQRTENQLEKIQQKIETLADQQKSLKADLAKTLQQQSQSGGDPQSSQGSESSSSSSSSSGQSSDSASESADPPSQASEQREGTPSPEGQKDQEQADHTGDPSEIEAGSDETQGDGPEGTKGSAGGSETSQQDGSSDPSAASSQSQANGGQQGTGRQQPDGAEAAQGQGDSGSQQAGEQTPGDAPGAQGRQEAAKRGDPSQADGVPSAESSAVADAQMRMLEAKQKALREQAAEVSSELAQMALPESSNHASVRDQAQERIDEAIENMKTFEDQLGDLRYDPGSAADRQSEMTDLAETAARELAQARQAIQRGLSTGRPQTEAEKAEALARQLAQDAESLHESVSPEQREQMAERLKAAERLLESMISPQQSTVSGGGAGGGHVYTKGDSTNQVEAARLLAQQFWSMAIQARDRQVRPVEDEPSDVEFFDAENEFFESAARFRPPGESR